MEGRGTQLGFSIKSKDLTLLMEQRKVKKRWKNYFRGLLEGEARGMRSGYRRSAIWFERQVWPQYLI